MKALVTGAAGFIGSSLVDRLLLDGFQVIGIDSFTPYYSIESKRANLRGASAFRSFSLIEADLNTCDIDELLKGITHIFHQAGQPGVRSSWGLDFATYVNANILTTSRLLEACRRSSTLVAFVAASSSSVYGQSDTQPTSEIQLPRPISPYGVTKLASENLCTLYRTEFDLPIASLRYFTVYGPRQRPEMAISQIIRSALQSSRFIVFGDGNQRRSFTYIDDVVNANVLTAKYLSNRPFGESVFNIGVTRQVPIMKIVSLVEEFTGQRIAIEIRKIQPGDPFETMADASLAEQTLGWSAETPFEVGIDRQIESIKSELDQIWQPG